MLSSDGDKAEGGGNPKLSLSSHRLALTVRVNHPGGEKQHSCPAAGINELTNSVRGTCEGQPQITKQEK